MTKYSSTQDARLDHHHFWRADLTANILQYNVVPLRGNAGFEKPLMSPTPTPTPTPADSTLHS